MFVVIGDRIEIFGGRRNHPLWHSYRDMVRRAKGLRKKDRQTYGETGCGICDSWGNFATFVLDMGPRPENHTLDRINPFIGYYPWNCRWSTRKQQANNTRKRWLKNAKIIRPGGDIHSPKIF